MRSIVRRRETHEFHFENLDQRIAQQNVILMRTKEVPHGIVMGWWWMGRRQAHFNARSLMLF